ncbi:MAG: glycosyltransferase family 4 protein [Desulfonatronovibrionaceae bacterium]
MHVLHLDLGPELRGGQKQVLYLLDHLASVPGINTSLGCLSGSSLERAASGDTEVFSFPSRQEIDPRNWVRLFSALREKKPAIVHTHEPRSASLAALFKQISPFSFFLLHTRRVSYPLSGKWGRQKYACADIVCCVSREVADILVTSGVPESRIRLVPSAIAVNRYKQRQVESRASLSLGVIGALTPQKGHEVLFHSLTRVGIDFRLYVAGEGELLPDLVHLVRKLGLEDRVEFCGRVPAAELLPRLDVAVIPSVDGEGSNAVIKEAWASGVPVVVSDLPSNTELVTHKRHGLVFPVRDPDTLASRIRELHADPDLARSLVENGLIRVKGFDVRTMGRTYAAIYARLADTRKGG